MTKYVMDTAGSKTTYKVVIALAFGLVGFVVNFYPLNVSIPPHEASFVWGLVFPMLISLSWGWKYGLLSATLGLGAQTMWFLWLPKNGWAVFVAVPVYNLWILWHGWCAKHVRKGLLSNIYGADIPYRIFFAIVFATIFSWSFRYNPSPWAPRMTLTTPPPDFIYFIQFKVIFEGYIILLLADVLRTFRFVRRILLIEEKIPGNSTFIISGAMLFGLLFWIVSGIAGFAFSTDGSTLAEHLILKVSPEQIAVRVFFIVICLVAGMLISNYFSKFQEAEAEKRSQARKAQTYLDTAGVMLCSLDISGKVTMINPKGAQILGYEQDEIIGKNWFENFLPHRFRVGLEGMFSRMVTGDEKAAVYHENPVLTRDNVEKIVAFYNTIVSEENGSVTGILFSGEDITERKQVEQELLEANNIINRSPIVIFLWRNTEGWPVEFVSENVHELFGYSAREFMNGSISYIDVIHPDDRERVGDEVSRFSSGTGRSEFKHEPYRIISRDSGIKWVEDITHIRRNDEGAITHYQGIVYDITDKHEADNIIKRSLREKEILLKEIHHRVKNNLAVISSLLFLQSNYVSDQKYLDMFRHSQNRINSMALVHEQLYSTDNFEQIDLKAYIDSLGQNVQNSHAMLRQVTISTQVDEIHMDIDSLVPLGLILNEILTNSFKYAFCDREDPEISLTVRKTGDGNVVLEVSDNGIGLPDGFDLDQPGGLGLQLVNMLTSQLNGHLEIKTDVGTMFRITFPEKLDMARHITRDG